jgi:hypothetical protein
MVFQVPAVAPVLAVEALVARSGCAVPTSSGLPVSLRTPFARVGVSLSSLPNPLFLIFTEGQSTGTRFRQQWCTRRCRTTLRSPGYSP